MESSSSKIQRFAPPRHTVPHMDLGVEEISTPAPVEPETQEHTKVSKAAQQTYLLQQKINGQSGGRPRYGEVTDQGSIGHTARLQLEVEKKRLGSQN